MTHTRHIIRQQVLELSMESETGARDIQEEVSEVFKTRMLPRMEQLFDKLSVAGQVLKINTLELDLGDIEVKYLKEDLPAKVERLLEEEITKLVYQQQEGIPGPMRAVTVGWEDARLETFQYLLRSGVHRWDSAFKEHSPSQLFEVLMQNKAAQVRDIMVRELKHDYVRKRVVYQFLPPTFESLIGLLAGSHSETDHALLNGLLWVGTRATTISGFGRAWEQLVKETLLQSMTFPGKASATTLAWIQQTVANLLTSWEGHVRRHTTEKVAERWSMLMQQMLQVLSTSAAKTVFKAAHLPVKTIVEQRYLSLSKQVNGEAYDQSETKSSLKLSYSADLQLDISNDITQKTGQSVRASEQVDVRTDASEQATAASDHDPSESSQWPSEEPSSTIAAQTSHTTHPSEGQSTMTPKRKGASALPTEPEEVLDNRRAATRDTGNENQKSGWPDRSASEAISEAHSQEPDQIATQEPSSNSRQEGEAATDQRQPGAETMIQTDLERRMTGDADEGDSNQEGPINPVVRADEWIQESATTDPKKADVVNHLKGQNSSRINEAENSLINPEVTRDVSEEDEVQQQNSGSRETDKDSERTPEARQQAGRSAEIGQSATPSRREPDAQASATLGTYSDPSKEMRLATGNRTAAGAEHSSDEEVKQSTIGIELKAAEHTKPDRSLPEKILVREDDADTHSTASTDRVSATPRREGSPPPNRILPHPEDRFVAPLWRKPPEIIEEAHIGNAGLALLWPYLPILFKGINWVEEGAFVSEEYQFRAIHFLQYMATGAVATEEQELTFNKLLVGMQPEVPVPFDVALTAAELEEAEHLLQTVLESWKALKSSSVELLRGTFLQKEGLLKKDMASWKLFVERSAYDILLDRLPWSYSVVKLPWMDNLINVAW